MKLKNNTKSRLVKKQGKKKPRYPIKPSLTHIAKEVGTIFCQYRFLKSDEVTIINLKSDKYLDNLILLDENEIKENHIRLNALDFYKILNLLKYKKELFDKLKGQYFYFSKNILIDKFEKNSHRKSKILYKGKRLRISENPVKKYVLCFEPGINNKNLLIFKIRNINWVEKSINEKYKVICIKI